MFQYSSSEAVIPSLVFTKAELVYALSVLMADIPPCDNTTRIEMVEVRHYLNQIKPIVAKAAEDGALDRAMDMYTPAPPAPRTSPPTPSMEELKARFPSLSDEEISDILANVRRERASEKEDAGHCAPIAPPPPQSFLAKEPLPPPMPTLDNQPVSQDPEKEKLDRENSIKFAMLLGSL